MIESVEKTEALIEIALGFGRVGRDLARIGAEAVVKRRLRDEYITDCKNDSRTDEDLKALAPWFHSNSEQKFGPRQLFIKRCHSVGLDDTMRQMEVADWAPFSDAELLERRISSLGLRLEGTALEPLIRQLYDELSAKGLVFHPPCHIGDEWFVPVGVPAIFIPFFLVHDRLRALERTMMLEVEGGTPEWFMKLMRHEAGHAYMYAYQLTRRKKWKDCFGQTSRDETPDTYRPRPFSRSYVVHLEDWYAQSHPDEDFAETFAVWLTPELDWRKNYAGWPALRKMEYVDELMRSLAGMPPVHTLEYRVADYDCLNVKLKTYYARKRKLNEDTYPDFYDADLRQLFAVPAGIKASAYLRRRRRRLLNAVCQWTNEKKFPVNQLLARLTRRCDELGLHVLNDDPQQDFRVAAFITTLVMNYLFTGKFKRTK
jgi:hypothetical protein